MTWIEPAQARRAADHGFDARQLQDWRARG